MNTPKHTLRPTMDQLVTYMKTERDPLHVCMAMALFLTLRPIDITDEGEASIIFDRTEDPFDMRDALDEFIENLQFLKRDQPSETTTRH